MMVGRLSRLVWKSENRVTIVILGGGGLIGHKLFEQLGNRFGDVYCTLHGNRNHSLFAGSYVHENVNVQDFEALTELLESLNANVVLNCVGITKRKQEINDLPYAISVNSLFPHKLAKWAAVRPVRIIHFSTDCVFDGALGNYTENSPTTGNDIYGKTKALGELRYPHSLTLRSSFIGRELTGKTELLEWCLAARDTAVNGFSKAFYSGVSTLTMARVVGDIIEHYPEISGLKQLATEQPISKYELLRCADNAFGLNMTITDDPSFETQPTLNGSLLRSEMSLELPSWKTMMAELAGESLYD